MPYEVARKARTDQGMPTLPSMDVEVIRAALEKAGVEFEIDVEGRPTVVLAKADA